MKFLNRFSAFIFDMDGTIIDNMPFHVKSWLLALHEFGIQINQAELIRHNHGTIGEVIRSIMGNDTSDHIIKAIADRKESLYRQIYRPYLKLLDGADSFLNHSKEIGIPMALATNASWDNINYVLDGLEIYDYFRVVLGNEDIKKGKPDPELFLLAAQRLGIAPEKCLVFEDSTSGILAAERAGMQTIAVSTSLEEHELVKKNSVVKVIQNYHNLDPKNIFNGKGN
jgi:beta-phosphoglucomutase family hydrolase